MEWVNVIDAETGKVTRIPRNELASNMAQIKFEGKKGLYWVDVAQFKQNKKIKHPPFRGELKKKVQEIQEILYCVRGMTYEEWERPFRCDNHPKREIDVWLSVARRFRALTTTRFVTPQEHMDVYLVLVSVLRGGKDGDMICPKLSVLNRSQVKELVDDFAKALSEGV